MSDPKHGNGQWGQGQPWQQSGRQQPQQQYAPRPPRRPWYKKKRWTLPLLLLLGLLALGLVLPETPPDTEAQAGGPADQKPVVATATDAPGAGTTGSGGQSATEISATAAALQATAEKQAKAQERAEAKEEAKQKAKKRKARRLKAERVRKKREARERRERQAEERRQAEREAAEEEAAEQEAEPADAYYENCTAASNAGAAPVHRGDPGYDSHLDRDGDGVGCES